MELKNYVLVVVVILAFALISINLNDMTGEITRSDSSAIIKVSPFFRELISTSFFSYSLINNTPNVILS